MEEEEEEDKEEPFYGRAGNISEIVSVLTFLKIVCIQNVFDFNVYLWFCSFTILAAPHFNWRTPQTTESEAANLSGWYFVLLDFCWMFCGGSFRSRQFHTTYFCGWHFTHRPPHTCSQPKRIYFASFCLSFSSFFTPKLILTQLKTVNNMFWEIIEK